MGGGDFKITENYIKINSTLLGKNSMVVRKDEIIPPRLMTNN